MRASTVMHHLLVTGEGSTSDMARTLRSNSCSILGGSSSMGSFRLSTISEEEAEAAEEAGGTMKHRHRRTLTPSEMGRKQLYEKVVRMLGLKLRRNL